MIRLVRVALLSVVLGGCEAFALVDFGVGLVKDSASENRVTAYCFRDSDESAYTASGECGGGHRPVSREDYERYARRR